MSTILKALRRLEEDRSAQSQRPLREEVTRGSASAKPRLGGWPLLAALLGLGVAVGAGALTFWYLGGAPEPVQPSELAAAGSAERRAEPGAPAKRPGRQRRARPARPRSAPAPAAVPRAAEEQELPAAALASKVETLKRPPAQPRIAAPGPAEPEASAGTGSGPSRRMDLAEIPGRHKPSVSRSRSGGPRSTAPRPEARAAPAPVVVAAAPKPERVVPEPPAGSAVARTQDAETQAATPEPESAPDESSKKAAKPAAAARKSEPASGEVARAEVPGLRVERTVWHPIAERRVAVIEFGQSAEHREIREGDAVGPLVVSKIEPSGVVFVHDGVEMRRRIGD